MCGVGVAHLDYFVWYKVEIEFRCVCQGVIMLASGALLEMIVLGEEGCTMKDLTGG